ncbi:hypothetical protein EZV62_026061 [Acer yangbiense]|uniref:Uncharacterized protein n=1 Tax=Acer yangbiense TaxID=1000413 RepID=A0A5C7GQN3_9ROSI|nr:hypothetical protein EZV62_026061 [Acer yangbiense]
MCGGRAWRSCLLAFLHACVVGGTLAQRIKGAKSRAGVGGLGSGRSKEGSGSYGSGRSGERTLQEREERERELQKREGSRSMDQWRRERMLQEREERGAELGRGATQAGEAEYQRLDGVPTAGRDPEQPFSEPSLARIEMILRGCYIGTVVVGVVGLWNSEAEEMKVVEELVVAKAA